MKTNSEEPPCDLGPITSVKIGDEVVRIIPHEGSFNVGFLSNVARPHLDNFLVSTERSQGRTVGGFNRTTGLGIRSSTYGSLHWFSANPEHIALSKRQTIEFNRKEAAKKAEKERLVDNAMSVAKCLELDGYEDQTTRDVAETLSEKFTEEQIATIKGWLNITT